MRPEEKLHRAIWEALDELTQEKLATPKDEWVLIGSRTPERKRAIEALKNIAAIKIVRPRKPTPPFGLTALYEIQGGDIEPIGYYVDTIEPRFAETLEAYYEAIGKRPEQTLGKEAIEKLTEKLKEWRNEPREVVAVVNPTGGATRTQGQKPPERKIEKLTFVQPENGAANKLTVVVNDDYQNPCHFDTKKPTGALLMKIMQGDETVPYAENKEPFDYLNGEKNQLIKKTGCVRTKMLTSEAGYITATVEIEQIREKAFMQRRGKAPKNA